MTHISEESLVFAREHIRAFYDSDFFALPEYFGCLWDKWDNVVDYLTRTKVGELHIDPPRRIVAVKPSGGFRVVHQLLPLETIAYTALVHSISCDIEKARPAKVERKACSYRIQLGNGIFFGGGTGYSDFTEQSFTLSKDNEFVLTTDIVDFYNQIYVHRLRNAIESVNSELSEIAWAIEHFVSRLNRSISRGIPVGPTASHILAEAILLDVDQFISGCGFNFTRYVDDYRIFSNNRRKLEEFRQSLMIYLYDHHRLVLNESKTRLQSSSEFVESQLDNSHAIHRLETWKKLDELNPYAEEEVEVDFDTNPEQAEGLVMESLKEMVDKNYVDIGILKKALRIAKSFEGKSVPELVISNLQLFRSGARDVFLMLDDFIDRKVKNDWFEELLPHVEAKGLGNDVADHWLQWHLAKRVNYLDHREVRMYLRESKFLDLKALSAVTGRDIATVREFIARYGSLGVQDRYSVLHAAHILSKDERSAWLRSAKGSFNKCEQILAGWLSSN